MSRLRAGYLSAWIALPALLPCAAPEALENLPESITRILDAPAPPAVRVAPGGKWFVLQYPREYFSREEMAKPVLYLAGWQLDPATSRRWYSPLLSVQAFSLLDSSTGEERRVDLPAGDYGRAEWSPDGRSFVVMRSGASATELWLIEAATAKARRVSDVHLNAARTVGKNGDALPCHWLEDSRRLVCLSIPPDRGPAPVRGSAGQLVIEDTAERPAGGAKIKSHANRGPRDAHEEALYDHYMTSQPVLIDIESGVARAVGVPAIYEKFAPSPDGAHFLAARIVKPYSALYTDRSFPKVFAVLDRAGRVERTLLRTSLSAITNSWMVGGMASGPRGFEWRPDVPASLIYYEASDGGDRMLQWAAPFDQAPVELFKSEGYIGFHPARTLWGEGGLAVVEEYVAKAHMRRAWHIDANRTRRPARMLWAYDADEIYSAPGEVVGRVTSKSSGEPYEDMFASGLRLLQDGDWIYFAGDGASEQGERPFLDSFNLRTHARQRLFQSAPEAVERVLAVLDRRADRVLVSSETASSPPNLQVFERKTGRRRVLTTFSDPVPEITHARRMHVEYKREDGVGLSGQLTLPTGYRDGTRVPVVLHAYPSFYLNPTGARQRRGSPHRFDFYTRTIAIDPLPLITQGYAVFDIEMPVVGENDVAGDTISAQMAANAKAAVEKVVGMGIGDVRRVGVIGHSFGGFMVGNLLANTQLFAAGVAECGFFNFTLTPGSDSQDDRRNYWEAPQAFDRKSPFRHADRITTPLLLIHSERDESGAIALQSQRMYEALYMLNGTARLVILPDDYHVPRMRDNVLRLHAEMLRWFDRYLKIEGGD